MHFCPDEIVVLALRGQPDLITHHMAVPGFQEMFLPFLQCIYDGKPRHTSLIREYIEQALQISDQDKEEMIPSGQSTKVANRVGWARTHLNKAGLVEPVSRGIYRITNAGKALVDSPPPTFNIKYLNTIPSHVQWFNTDKPGEVGPVGPPDLEEETPQERIDLAIRALDNSLRSELLDHLTKVDPYRFEQIVIDLLFAMGYGGSREEAAMVTKKSGDEGIDGVINEDRLGLDVIYVQAKRWQNQVGRKEIQSFVGALAGKQANKGVFITTSGFASTATEYAAMVTQKVILIDGSRLADLMIEHNVGVSVIRAISIKRIDSDYFEES